MTDTIPKVIEIARRAGLDVAADRLDYLYSLPVDDGDLPMNPKTAKSLVTFMSEHPELATDAITVNSEGFVNAIWNFTPNSKLDAQFFPSGNVWFAYLVNDNDSGDFKILKRGDTYPNDMLETVMPLIEGSR